MKSDVPQNNIQMFVNKSDAFILKEIRIKDVSHHQD